MKIKKITLVLFFSAFLFSCSDNQSELSENVKNNDNQKKESVKLEDSPKKTQDIRLVDSDSKEKKYPGWSLIKEKEEKKLNDYCQKVGSDSQEHCMDSLQTLIEIKYDSLSQTDLFKKMKEKQIAEQNSYARQIAQKKMPNPPGPESFFRLIAIKNVLGEK